MGEQLKMSAIQINRSLDPRPTCILAVEFFVEIPIKKCVNDPNSNDLNQIVVGETIANLPNSVVFLLT